MRPDGERFDPVEKHYALIEETERLGDMVSWAAVLVFAVYVGLHLAHLEYDQYAKLAFVLLTILAVSLSYWIRFVEQPPADRRRRRVLFRDATRARTSTESQNLYWNNLEEPSLRRLLFNLAENTFFVPRLLQHELHRQVVLVVLSTIGLVVSIRFGSAEVVELFAVLLVFSEALLGKLVRMIWTLSRMRHLHVDLAAELRARTPFTVESVGRVMYLAGEYEYIKGRAGYRASDHTFRTLNPSLTEQWNAYRDALIGECEPSDANQRLLDESMRGHRPEH